MNFLSNFNLFNDGRVSRLIQSENKITALFTDLETVQGKAANKQLAIEQLETKQSELNEQNASIPDDNLAIEERNRQLRWRKWAVVIVDAILGFAALNLFLSETINVQIPMIPSFILGIMVAYLLLKLALSFKHYDSELDGSKGNTLTSLLNRYSFVIPLLLIPFLSLYLILHSPENPANVLWLFFLVLCFILNLKVAAFSSQYIEMEVIRRKSKVQSRLQSMIKSTNARIDKLQDQSRAITGNIRREATNLRRTYQSFPEGERPELSLARPYRFVLNNRVYFRDVLPLDEGSLTIPERRGPSNRFLAQWDQAIGSTGSLAQQNLNGYSRNGVNDNPTQDSMNESKPDYSEPNADDSESFGRKVSDNEKFI